VDKEGKQLPYIDKLVSPKVQDGEMENMKTIVGESDILRRNAALVKLPLYKENEAKGGYDTLILDYHLLSPVMFFINMTYPDPSFRQVVNDIRFRKAVSFGIDHKEIIDSVFLQQGIVPKLIPSGLNPTEGNKLLDEMGMKVGANGFRMAVDGKPFQLLIEVGATAADQVPTAELISSHLKKNLKLDVSFKKLDTTLFNQKNAANEIQATLFWAFDAMADDEASIRWVGNAGPLWSRWRADPKTGEEPPDWVKKGIELDKQRTALIYGTPDYYKHKEVETKYFYDNIPAISVIEGPKIPLILSKKIANGPVAGYQIAGLMLVEGMYFK
jgi:peptide/nickel transport system substrate-binding protein